MQIIQSIRDKGAAIVIVVIALSLIGFILMDARQGSNQLFGSMSTHVGEVNDKGIELGEFNKRVKQGIDQQEQQSRQSLGNSQTAQIREQTWNQIIAERIFTSESEKLGIAFTAKELSNILLSNDPGNPLLQEEGMKDANGRLDIVKAQEAISRIKKFKGEQRDIVDTRMLEPLKLTSNVAKYSGLLNASAYYPKWMQDKETKDAKTFAVISYTNIPYSEIPDSTIKISDDDINDYVKKNPELFKQEEGRSISYVTFSQLPAQEDSLRIKNYVAELATTFAADTNSQAFVARNSSSIEFEDKFIPKAKVTSPMADTILKLPVGSVYGPYVDRNSFVLAKMVAIKDMPDSVRARHILIPINDTKNGQPARDDSTAKKLADSILTAINAGADFAALALQYSSDGSRDKGGDLGTYGYGTMVAEFNDFSFTEPVGSKNVVQTQFGYHVIEILNQKDFKPAYKIAYLGKDINASDVTINKASLEATRASAEKNAESLAKFIGSKGLKMTEVPTVVKENDFSVGALQDARPLVRWVFEAKKGDISEPFSIGDQFVVAVVNKIHKKGVQDASTARAGSEVIIKNKKKAELIKKKIGTNPTLESAAKAYNKEVQQAGADSSITFASQIINGVGMEPKIIGASFNKDYTTRVSPPIEGNSGIFLLKVNSIQSKPADTPEMIESQAKTRITALRSQLNNWYEGLKKQADIQDKRSEHF